MECEDCKGRGWYVGECHPREVCNFCDGLGMYPYAVAALLLQFLRDVVLWYSGFKLGYDWAIRDFYEGGY